MGKKKNNKNFDDFFDATLTIDDVKAKGKKKNKKKKDPVAEDTQADINNNVSDPVVENEASDILTGEVKSTAQEPLKSEEPQEIQEKQLEEEPDKNTQPIKQGRIHDCSCRGRLGRGSNDLGRGSNDLGRGILKYKLFNP